MIIASNFKTNHTRASSREFIQEIASIKTSHQVRIFAPFTALDDFKLPLHVKVGAQNFYPVEKGAFTGEIGAIHLDEFNIKSVLIGHSERRHILCESNKLIQNKFAFAKDRGWEITYCIGEPKEVRLKGDSAVMDYIDAQLEGIDLDYENLILAYEPVWAIGTGLSASLEQISSTHQGIKSRSKAPLLYGGSVKIETIVDIGSLKECDGVLVGSASWKKEDFAKMIETVENKL
jgi:triosephosphate isomerase